MRVARWKCRTDLTYLCNEVLGFTDVTGPERFPFINILQKFPVPAMKDLDKYDRFDRGNWIYTPISPMMDLKGSRRVLILDPRGFLKTTINATAHTIQWILNYPDIAMMVIQSNGEKAQMILSGIKQHFQGNPKFRILFPEHCPMKKPMDWGTKSDFTTEARGKTVMRREPTLMIGSIDKGSSGIHVDVMKFSDIVEPNNVKTSEQIDSVIQSFGMMENLLVAPRFWIDVEGTRYSHSDLYGRIIEAEMKRPPEEREYKIHVRACYKKDTTSIGGGPEKFTPEELDTLPYLYDADGKKISWWPERWSTEELEKKRKNPALGEYLFATQQLQNPTEAGGELPFPVDSSNPKWISPENFRRNIKVVYHTTTVDTAETKSNRADYTAITTVAWDQAGRPYVVDVRHGKWLPDGIIDEIISVYLKYNPLVVSIEETGYVRGMKDGLMRRLHTANLHINFKFLARESGLSKPERILNTLQPFYKHGELRFLQGLGHGLESAEGTRISDHMLEEFRKFPYFRNDDILDSLADHFQGKEWGGRLAPRNENIWDQSTPEETRKVLYSNAFNRHFGLETPFLQQVDGYLMPVPQDGFYNRTGGM